jgi:DNA repair protein RecO (recombination protein O)
VQVKTKAIVLSSLKFQEKSLIVKCFTLSHGLKSYLFGMFFRKEIESKNRLFPTLNHSRNRSRSKQRHFRKFQRNKIASAFHSIHSDIYKSTMVMFIPKCCIIPFMKRKKTNHFYILETALHWLDNHDEIANFHLILLLETTKYLVLPRYSDVAFSK